MLSLIQDNKKIKTLDDLVRSYVADCYTEDYLGLQARILSGETEPEILTHADYIEFWRNLLNDVLYKDLSETRRNKIHKEIDKIEKYHEDHDQLYECVLNYDDYIEK